MFADWTRNLKGGEGGTSTKDADGDNVISTSHALSQ